MSTHKKETKFPFLLLIISILAVSGIASGFSIIQKNHFTVENATASFVGRPVHSESIQIVEEKTPVVRQPLTTRSYARTAIIAPDSANLLLQQQISASEQDASEEKIRRETLAAQIKQLQQVEKEQERNARTAESSFDPGTIRAQAYQQMIDFGYTPDQWQYLDQLAQRESGWNPHAQNASSGAYGIPQALPGSKMASIAADWKNNPTTQITWMLTYIKERYGNPQNAWAHSQAKGFY